MIELAVPQPRGCQARLQALNQRPVTVIGERVQDGRTRTYSPCGGICSVFTDRKEVDLSSLDTVRVMPLLPPAAACYSGGRQATAAASHTGAGSTRPFGFHPPDTYAAPAPSRIRVRPRGARKRAQSRAPTRRRVNHHRRRAPRP